MKRPSFLAAKCLQFFFQASFGGTTPYMPLIYMKYHHLNKQQVGIIQCISQCVAFPACILWAGIADRLQWRRRVMAFLTVISAGGVLLFALRNLQFHHLAILAASFYFFLAAIAPIGDTLTLEMLGEQKEKYGQQRLWGALAAAIMSTSCGQVIHHISDPNPAAMKDYTPAFINFSVWSVPSLITLYVSYRMKITPRQELPRDLEGLKQCEDIDPAYPDIAIDHPALHHVMRHPKTERHWLLHLDVISFYIAVFAFSMATMTLISLLGTSQILLEIPFFYYSDQILKSIGIKQSIILAYFALTMRVLLLSIVPATSVVWSVVAIELAHGLSFACLWNGAVYWADLIAPKNRSTTSQGALSAALALGSGVGSLVGGFIYGTYGSRVMWWSLAFMCVVFGGFYAITPLRDLEGRHHKRKSKKKMASEIVETPALEMTEQEMITTVP